MQQPMFGSDAVLRFHQELLDSVESLVALGEMYGPQVLAFIVYLQKAILDGSHIDVFPEDDPAILGLLEGMPSYDQWIRFVKTHFEGQEGEPFVPVREQQCVSAATLRTDVPNEVLEMLLFDDVPRHRSREELEAQFAMGSSIPYLVRWLGEPPERVEMLEKAKALGFNTIKEMNEHDHWLVLNGSQKFRDWYREVNRAQKH